MSKQKSKQHRPNADEDKKKKQEPGRVAEDRRDPKRPGMEEGERERENEKQPRIDDDPETTKKKIPHSSP